MKTTVVIADDLFRRAKSTAALRGRKFKDLVEEGLRRVIDEPQREPAFSPTPSVHEMMRQYCGSIDSGVSDLATNPDHMEGFGGARVGDR